MTTFDDIAQPSFFWTGKTSEGALGHAGPYNRQTMAAMIMLLLGERDGVLSGLTVGESTPNGKSVTVAAGKCVIRGILGVPDVSSNLTIADNASGNPRIDVIVAECDWTAQTIELAVVQGTPAASPAAPSLTQTDGVLWQEPLAQVAVADSFVTITDAEITDWRQVIDLKADTGDVKPLLSATVPDGWLLCYGQAVSRTRYADLFAHLGTLWGAGDGSTTFNLPDLRDRVLAGKGDMGGVDAALIADAASLSLGGTMGEDLHTMTEAELVSHTHSITGTYWRSDGTPTRDLGATATDARGAAAVAANTGSSTPFNVVQPTAFVNFMVKW